MGRNRNKRDRATQPRKNTGRGDSFVAQEDIATLGNPLFEKFYRGAVVPEEQWDSFMASLRVSLPSCFRFNTSLPQAAALRDAVVSQLRELGQDLTPLAFVPCGMAIQTNASRGEIKRNAQHKIAKKMIHALNEEGLLSRQEAVSMIPALLLDVQPGHRVIDMCAAPGSKTTQILELLIGQGPGGVVVANDVNQGRLDVLNHQTARLPDAKSRLIVTNHDATAFPLVTAPEHKFDRVLCDVMCSGDGTLRKSMDLWARWTPLLGPLLHVQQSRVLMRGMGLCKKGGIVVYSTCSMSPAEDEAVIARCLAEAGGTFELMSPLPILKDLKCYAGKHSWRLMNADATVELTQFSDSRPVKVDTTTTPTTDAAIEAPAAEGAPTAEGAPAATAVAPTAPSKGKSRFTFTPTMFPPPADKAAEMHLERCVRVVPHLQDTGGFFIAALRCLEELPRSVNSTGKGKYESTHRPLSQELVVELRRSIELPDDFPFHRLFTPAENARNPKVYYLSEDCAEMTKVINAKVIQAGVKVFESAVKRSWAHARIACDGAATLAHVLPSCVVDFDAAAVLERFMIPGTEIARFTMAEFKAVAPGVPQNRRHSIVRLRGAEWVGDVLLPMEIVADTVYIRATMTQVSLLKLSLGVPLLSADELHKSGDEESDEGSDSDDAADDQADRGQPAAE